MNYRAAGRAVVLVKRSGVKKSALLGRFAGLLRRVSSKLPSRIAGLGAKMQSGTGKLAGKLGFSDIATRLGTKAQGARQLLNLGTLSPKQLGFMRFAMKQPTAFGQVARGQSKHLGSAFKTGLGTLGVGGALGAAGLHDAATGKLFGGGQPQQPTEAA